MAAPRTVRLHAPNFTTANTVAGNRVRAALPVRASHWLQMAKGVNWLMGNGGALVGGGPYNTAIAAGAAEVLFRYWCAPRYANGSWVWVVTLETTGSAYGTLTNYDSASGGAGPVTVGDWSMDGKNGVPHMFTLPLNLDAHSDTPTGLCLGIYNNTLSESSIKVTSVGLYELQRKNLQSKHGVDLSNVDRGSVIYQNSSDALDVGIEAVHRISRKAKHAARKNHVFSWWNPAGVGFTTTSFVDLFPLLPHVMARHLENGRTTRNLMCNIYAKVTGGDQTGEVSLSTTVGTSTTTEYALFPVTNTTAAWQTPRALVASTEDPARWATDGGLRTGTRETFTASARKTGTTTSLTLYGLSVYEADADPLQILGCNGSGAARSALWLRADRGITTVSSKVSAWAMQSYTGPAVGTAVAQGTAGNRPPYVNDGSGQNGHAYLNFNSGDSTWLDASFSTWPSGSGTYMCIVVNNTSTAGTQYALDLSDGVAVHDARIVLANGSANMYGRALLGATDENTGAVAATTGVQVIEVFRNSVTDKLELWQNGVRLSQSAAVATNTTGASPSNLTIGRDSIAIGNYFDGHIYEIVIATIDPTNNILADMADYIERRYRMKSCAKLTS